MENNTLGNLEILIGILLWLWDIGRRILVARFCQSRTSVASGQFSCLKDCQSPVGLRDFRFAVFLPADKKWTDVSVIPLLESLNKQKKKKNTLNYRHLN
jgi:hypothetical protein